MDFERLFISHPSFFETKKDSEKIIGIIGGGIAGLALAIALQKHKIRSVVFEKDESFDSRHQGYGLTMQQGGRALKTLGLSQNIAENSVSSHGHFVFDSEGYVILYWMPEEKKEREDGWTSGRNCHISRQNLRHILLDALDPDYTNVVWNSKLDHFVEKEELVELWFKDCDSEITVNALAGCDGIYSKVRKKILGDDLSYLGVFVMLGIFDNSKFSLCQDRVIQMSNGSTRVFAMPYDKTRWMWQLSFPYDYDASISLSSSGSLMLKETALELCKDFANPFLNMIEETSIDLITGYPVYDRDPLQAVLKENSLITLLGDAAHPMSPFKGQGANQALLDAVILADEIKKNENLKVAMRKYENNMIERTKNKVLGSRMGVSTLHCKEFLDTEYQLERRGFGNSNSAIELINSIRDQGIKCDDDRFLELIKSNRFVS
ncbi:FAD/NAD(P)-binding domain-containing protein [Rozella allomycis CSF55]|uniref:FAD/NAD(P)-binding domain-containing protein n=1 Tax=Rozella allomycis (strain CSF55) TaxID=988480 RepID=A0A4P9YEH9_ROZAC|nr:FAD/NAD(P)-binding domain-containing protein [Rozella allomycis CSF55]